MINSRANSATPAAVWRVAALLALASMYTAGADSSWNYAGVKSKAEAVALATGVAPAGVAGRTGSAMAARRGDGTNTDNATRTRGQGACSDAMFDNWAATFNLTFGSRRRQAQQRFCDNMERVRAINSDPSISFWASGNQYSHMSFEDFTAQFLTGLAVKNLPSLSTPSPAPRKLLVAPTPTYPGPSPAQKTYVNWVEAGKVTGIRNQGACNSCWAFAAVSAIESMYLIKFGGNASDPAMHLSEQQLVSCVNSDNGYHSSGCSSGLSDEALDYAADKNLTLNSVYPYTATTGTCNNAIINGAGAVPGKSVRLAGYHKTIPYNNENAFIQAVSSAPTVFYFAADMSFMLYSGGIYTPLANSTGNVNHGMVAVGFNITDANNRYWIIRNSWGTGWGEGGYARVIMTRNARNGMGPCGMYQYAYQPSSNFTSTTRLLAPAPAPAESALQTIQRIAGTGK